MQGGQNPANHPIRRITGKSLIGFAGLSGRQELNDAAAAGLSKGGPAGLGLAAELTGYCLLLAGQLLPTHPFPTAGDGRNWPCMGFTQSYHRSPGTGRRTSARISGLQA